MKLLLHTCCAPCLIYPLKRLKEEGFELTALFYNPNIHPFAEYNKRKEAVMDYSKRIGIEVIYPQYDPRQYFHAVNKMEEGLQRCLICWHERLKITAQSARERNFTHFSSTLLVSPYQDQESLSKIGRNLTSEEKVEFYYEDFRLGFKEAHDQAKKDGIYCQKYCGCIYSEIERCRKSLEH